MIMVVLLILDIYIYVFAFVLKHYKRASPCQDLILNSVEMSVKCMY